MVTPSQEHVGDLIEQVKEIDKKAQKKSLDLLNDFYNQIRGLLENSTYRTSQYAQAINDMNRVNQKLIEEITSLRIENEKLQHTDKHEKGKPINNIKVATKKKNFFKSRFTDRFINDFKEKYKNADALCMKELARARVCSMSPRENLNRLREKIVNYGPSTKFIKKQDIIDWMYFIRAQ